MINITRYQALKTRVKGLVSADFKAMCGVVFMLTFVGGLARFAYEAEQDYSRKEKKFSRNDIGNFANYGRIVAEDFDGKDPIDAIRSVDRNVVWAVPEAKEFYGKAEVTIRDLTPEMRAIATRMTQDSHDLNDLLE